MEYSPRPLAVRDTLGTTRSGDDLLLLPVVVGATGLTPVATTRNVEELKCDIEMDVLRKLVTMEILPGGEVVSVRRRGAVGKAGQEEHLSALSQRGTQSK